MKLSWIDRWHAVFSIMWRHFVTSGEVILGQKSEVLYHLYLCRDDPSKFYRGPSSYNDICFDRLLIIKDDNAIWKKSYLHTCIGFPFNHSWRFHLPILLACVWFAANIFVCESVGSCRKSCMLAKPFQLRYWAFLVLQSKKPKECLSCISCARLYFSHHLFFNKYN